MFFRKIGLLAVIGAAALVFGTSMRTHAENLHQKYRDLGDSSWNCNRIVITDPRAAKCAACERQGMDFDDSGAGSCIARESLRDRAKRAIDERHGVTPKKGPPSVVGDRDKNYGALAYFKTTLPSGQNHAVAASGYGPTEIDAEGAAKSACVAHGGRSCSIVGNFSHGGCGYVLLCAKSNNVGYGVGKSEAEARSQCLGGNFDRGHLAGGGCTTRH